jgi:hypothetical protein
VSTSAPQVLAQRQKQRLSEAASTLDKRLAWAKQQVAKSGTAGLFDNIIPNGNMAEVRGPELLAAQTCVQQYQGQPAAITDRTPVQHAVRAQPGPLCVEETAAALWPQPL